MPKGSTPQILRKCSTTLRLHHTLDAPVRNALIQLVVHVVRDGTFPSFDAMFGENARKHGIDLCHVRNFVLN
jgi:hypothetical protein